MANSNKAFFGFMLLMGTLPAAAFTFPDNGNDQAAAQSPLVESVVTDGQEIDKSGLVTNRFRSGRLKFRDGPVCMCADGLTEKDINNAADERVNKEEQQDKKQ